MESLEELFETKDRLLQELINLSRQQYRLIKEQDLDKLERLLKSKQVRMDKVDEINQRLPAVPHKYREWERRITARLEELAVLDQQNQELIQQNFGLLKNRIQRIKQGKNLRSRYERGFTRSGGVFLDRRK